MGGENAVNGVGQVVKGGRRATLETKLSPKGWVRQCQAGKELRSSCQMERTACTSPTENSAQR
jgi:hypothetical protein